VSFNQGGGMHVRRRPARRTSLKTQSLVRLGFLLLVIFSIATFIEARVAQRERSHLVETRGRLVAELQATALATPIWDLDDRQVKVLLGALQQDPDFSSARILDNAGRVLASLSGAAAADDDFVITSPITFNSRPLGMLEMRLSAAASNSALRGTILGIGGWYLILLLVVSGAAWIMLHRILAPLSQLRSVMSKLAAGALDTQVSQLHRSDEVGEMAEAVQTFKENAEEVQRLFIERERLQAEANVQLLQRRFEQAIDSTGQAIALYDGEDVLVACNTPYLELHRQPDEACPEKTALIGLTFRAALDLRMKANLYVFDEKDREEFIAMRVARHRNDQGEQTNQLRDGRWMRILVRRTSDRGVINLWTDITSIKAAEVQQRDLQDQLHHSQRLESLGTLAGGIAHDLNNTLVPILGLVELTAEFMPEGSGDRQNLEIVASAARRAKELVRQILAFSRKESGRSEMFNMARLTREAMTLLRSAVPATIAIDTDIADVAPVRGDEGQFHQVIVNLVTNAASAIGTKQGSISVSLQLVLRDDGASVNRLRVEDTGCGMDEATRARIFEPFFTTKPVNEGTGLGLSVVHGIITAHGGRIDVASTPGQGTTFEMDLPIAVEEELPQAAYGE